MSVDGGCDFLREGKDDDEFVITRAQARRLADFSYDLGKRKRSGKTLTFHYVRKVTPADDWWAEQVARAKWLNIVTANHLRKARAELHDLRLDNEFANAELRLWRGSEHRKCDTPGHYAGDGYVTCSRAMESASVQDEVAPRSAMQMWWWMCAFKYVWRMWSKADPVADAEKAIDCLGHVAAHLEEDADER